MTSYVFLLACRYARMQYQSLSGSPLHLTFDDVVPKTSSTTHVAAAALYHCLGKYHCLRVASCFTGSISHLYRLVLGTKNLIQLHQEEAYGQITIRIK